jgi:hypothetical protein
MAARRVGRAQRRIGDTNGHRTLDPSNSKLACKVSCRGTRCAWRLSLLAAGRCPNGALAAAAGPQKSRIPVSSSLDELNRKMSRYRWYPVLQIGISYRF